MEKNIETYVKRNLNVYTEDDDFGEITWDLETKDGTELFGTYCGMGMECLNNPDELVQSDYYLLDEIEEYLQQKFYYIKE